MAEIENEVNRLKDIAEKLNNIKKGGNLINQHESIELYLSWRFDSENLFSKYIESENDNLQKFKGYSTEGNGYTLIGKYFTRQYFLFNILINEITQSKGKNMVKDNLQNKIFISHSSKDKPMIDLFRDIILRNGLGIQLTNIFYSSGAGTNIKSGEDWRNEIKENLLISKIIFHIVTPNYKESEICHNEFGASWVSDAKVIPLIIEPIKFETVGVLKEVKQCEKLNDKKSLDKIRDILQQELNIPNERVPSDNWTEKRDEFLGKLDEYIKSNPFQVPLERSTFNNLVEEYKKLKEQYGVYKKEWNDLNSYVSNLESLKDREEVDKIKQYSGKQDNIDKFNELAWELEKAFGPLSNFLLCKIFNGFTRKNLTISTYGEQKSISDAKAHDYLDEDLKIDWKTNPRMTKIFDALNKLSKFMEEVDDDELDRYIREKLEVPFNINNLDFWIKVFGKEIDFN